MRSLNELAGQDAAMRGAEFCLLAKRFAAQHGSIPNALDVAEKQHTPARVREFLKAAVTAGSTSLGSPSAWGDELVGYKPLAEGFFASLRSQSVFFRLLGDAGFARTPMRTRIAMQVSSLTGSLVRPGQPKPARKFDLTAANLEPVKAAALLVCTDELLAAVGPAAEAAFGRELRGGVADTVDAAFFDIVAGGVVGSAATADPDANIQTLLDAVNTTGAGLLYFAMRPATANLMATLRATGGQKSVRSDDPDWRFDRRPARPGLSSPPRRRVTRRREPMADRCEREIAADGARDRGQNRPARRRSRWTRRQPEMPSPVLAWEQARS